jgi:dolichol-phosphate mannosyltransferase
VVGNSFRSILSYSAKPLAWVSVMGIILSLTSVLGIFALAIFWIIRGVPFLGFGSVIGVTILSFSITMLCIGILAQYMGLIYEEVKRRPLYLVTETTLGNRLD